MEAVSLAKRLRPKTYSIALYLVGIVLVVQLGAFLSVFYFRRVVNIDTNAPPLPTASAAATVTPLAPAPTVTKSTPPVLNPPERISPGVTPGRLAVAPVEDVAQRVRALNEEANRFELQGDLRLAAVALFRAESLNPRDPATLMNLAKLFMLEKDFEKARAYWQRVVDLGPDIGPPYAIAREQLVVSATRTATASTPPATATRSTPLPAAASGLSKALFVDRVEKTLAAGNASGNEFTMRIVLGAGNTPGGVQAGKIDIKLYFYDQQASGAIVPNRGQLKVAFIGAPAKLWNFGQRETLQASYLLTPEQARIYNQKFYGYMLRIYYDGKLQDERAEPESLLKFFPAT